MLTTIADHNDIRLESMKSESGESCPQVNDSSRQGAGSLQARDQCQPFLDSVLACTDRRPHMWWAAPRDREQGRAGSLHPEVVLPDSG